MAHEKRLIDVNVFLDKFYKQIERYEDPVKVVSNVPFLIERCSTVDAVEVVRCKDCRYWTYDGYHKHHYCSNAMGLRYVCPANNFCSNGERKDNG